MWPWHSEESLEELPALESTYFSFTLIKRRQKLLIPAATTTNHLDPSQIFSLRIEVGRKRWRGVGDVVLVGNGVVPIRGLGKGDLPRKSLVKIGHSCKRRSAFHDGRAHWYSDRLVVWDLKRELWRKSPRVSVGQVDGTEGGWRLLSLVTQARSLILVSGTQHPDQ